MSDLIDRQTAIETAIEAADKWDGGYSSEREGIIRKFFDKIPAAQPDHTADIGKKVSISCGHENDLVFREAAIEALARMMPRSYTPDGSHPADEEIFRAQEVFADCIEALEILPSAQPATNCSEIPNGSDDTISRQAAIDAITDELMPSTPLSAVIRAKNRLKELPSAQPEIIRCKDFKFSHMTNDGCYCKYCDQFTDTDDYGELVEMYFDSDFYCGYAERRTDG